MYIILAVIVIILLIFIFEINKKKIYELKRNIEFAISLPGPSIFSSFVNSLQIACNHKGLLNYVDLITKKYGNRTRLILGTDIFVVLSKPEDYKLVLTNENGNDKSSVTKAWEMLLGDGIIRASGPTHKLRRKIIQPLFNIKYLSEYVTCFDTYSNLCVDILEKNVYGPMFDLKPYIARYSFNIYLETIVGIHESICKHEFDELLYWQEKLVKDAYNKMTKLWQFEWILSRTKSKKQMRIVQKNMLDFIYGISKKVASHTALQDNSEVFEKSKPVFHKYYNRVEELRVRNNNSVRNKACEVSDENFLDDVGNFYSAIQNTITEITCFIMRLLAMHTEVQEKLREEIFVTFNDNNKINAQCLFNMRYFYMVYQETLRLFPLSPIILRQLTGDIKLDSCTLPNGCYAMVSIFTVHRNPAYWHKPLEFIPERFSPENCSKRYRYTYIPFGTGLRDCLGQRYAFLSVATIIINLLRRYRFVNNNSNINDIKLIFDIILRIQDTRLSITPV